MTTPAPATPSVSKAVRIEHLLQALAVLAAEFGPVWVHSEQGKSALNAGVTTITAIAAAEQAITGK